MIRMNGTKREFVLHEAPLLVITQGDIRQVQLAKGAILSGFMAVLSWGWIYILSKMEFTITVILRVDSAQMRKETPTACFWVQVFTIH